MMKPTILLLLLAPAFASSLRRDLRYSSSSSSSWSFWSSLFQVLDKLHTPCPPGKLHHKDSSGKPLPPGQCWQDLKPHKHHSHHSSHHSSSSGSHSSSHSYNVTYDFIECQEGDAGCYQNLLCDHPDDDDANCMEYIQCPDDDQDCQMWIKCDDDSEDCMAHVAEWGDDGYSADDTYDDDQWNNDGWTSNNLDQGSSYASSEIQTERTAVWPFLLTAFVAGVIGAMFVVARRKRREERSEHPLDGAVKKRQRLFAGMSRNSRKVPLGEDFDCEDDMNNRPKFIEISESPRKSYQSPSCEDSL